MSIHIVHKDRPPQRVGRFPSLGQCAPQAVCVCVCVLWHAMIPCLFVVTTNIGTIQMITRHCYAYLASVLRITGHSRVASDTQN